MAARKRKRKASKRRRKTSKARSRAKRGKTLTVKADDIIGGTLRVKRK